jgi:hypothetical protein
MFAFRWVIAVALFAQEDPVLLTPEDRTQKPYVAIIKVCDWIRDLSNFKWRFLNFYSFVC